MKKNLSILLFATSFVATALTGCDPSNGRNHEHVPTAASVIWTWNQTTTATAQIKCSECGEVLADSLPAAITSRVQTNPTCTDDGSKVYTAKVTYEGLEFENKKTVSINALGHDIDEEIIPQQDPGCEKTGLRAHYECLNCGEFFIKNASGEFEKCDDIEIPAKGHTYGSLIPEDPAKCGHQGTKAHYQCSECRQLFDQNKVKTTAEALKINAPEHSFNSFVSVDDENHVKVCSNCDEEVVSAHEYEYAMDNYGSTHTATCSECGHSIDNAACVFEWEDNDYVCKCGREGEIQIPQIINCDLVVNDNALEFGPNATEFTVTGAGEGSEITDVKVGGVSYWDIRNHKLDETIMSKFSDKVTLDVEITNGENIKVFKNLATHIVSKVITTEAELKSMSKIANILGKNQYNKDTAYTGYFLLGNDITLTTVPNENGEDYTWGREHCMQAGADGGAAQSEVGSLQGFNGIIDGAGHTIYNLNTIRNAENINNAAPFIWLLNQYGIIRNIAFHGLKTSGKGMYSLVGYGCGTIENVYVALKQLGMPNNTAGSHLELFFAGNTYKDWYKPTPVLKNVVVEFNGANDCEFDDATSHVKDTSKSGYLLTTDWTGHLPTTEDVVVITNNSNVKSRLVHINIQNFAPKANREAEYERYSSVAGSASGDFLLASDEVSIAGLDILTKESRYEVYEEKGDDWCEAWNSIWAEGSKAAKFDDTPPAPKSLAVSKGKSSNAAIDNVVNITDKPLGTSKVQVSTDNGSTWKDVVGSSYDYTLDSCTKLTFRALDSSEAVLETKEVEIDLTKYVAGDASINQKYQGFSLAAQSGDTDFGGGTIETYNGTSTDSMPYWRDTDTGRPSSGIKYKAKGIGDALTWNATTRVTLSTASVSKYNSIIPGATQRIMINTKGGEYRKDGNGTSLAAPYGIKKIALWGFFTNFIVTYEDTTTEKITKIYNKGLFMTPLTTATGSGTTPNGYLASAAPYEVIQGGVNEKEFYQFAYDLSDWNDTNKFSLFSFTPTVTLGTLTGNAEDMSKHLLDEGVTFNGKKVVDYTFSLGLNCVQFVY